MAQRTARDEVEKEIGQAESSIVSVGFGISAKEGVEQTLAYDSQSTGRQIGQHEQECGLCYTKTPLPNALSESEICQAKAKAKYAYAYLLISSDSFIIKQIF